MSAPSDELPARTRTRPWRTVVSALAVAAVAVGMLPDLAGLDARAPFAQVVAFRPVLLGALLVLGVGAVGAAVVRRRGWTLAAGLLVVGAVASLLVLPRGLAGPEAPQPDALQRPAITVLSFNVYEGRADVAALADLVRSTRPDVVALPEAGRRFGDKLLPLLPDYRFVTSQERGPNVQGVSTLTRADLGEVTSTIDRSTPFASVVLQGGRLGRTRFVAYHSVAPKPGDVSEWRHDLGTLEQYCGNRDAGPVIIAGDFNATLDHSLFRAATLGCADAAAQTGNGLTGTWPTRLPRFLGTQIDHVLVTGGVSVETFSIHDLPGSDHRALLTRLLLP